MTAKEIIEQIQNGASESDVIQILSDMQLEKISYGKQCATEALRLAREDALISLSETTSEFMSEVEYESVKSVVSSSILNTDLNFIK